MHDQKFKEEVKNLKVAFVGNQGNNSYRVCKWGRHMGVDAHLFHCPTKYNTVRSLPELIDPELKQGYPDWINVLDKPPYGFDAFSKHPDLVEHLNSNFDAIITSGEWGVRELHHFNGPALYHFSLGGDIGHIPWQDWRSFDSKTKQYRQRMYQASLHRYNAIYTTIRSTIEKLGTINLADRAYPWAHPEDVSANRKRANKELLVKLNARYGDKKRVFLWLSRLMMDPTHYGSKKVDIFIKAAANFIKQNPDYPVSIIMGYHGPDREAAHQLVENLGISDMVDWIDHQPYTYLLSFLSMPNAVVFDDFSRTDEQLSGMGRDATSVGAVVVKRVDLKWTGYLFAPGCPLLPARTQSECLKHMNDLKDDTYFKEKQEYIQEWGLKYLDYPYNVKKFYRRILEDVSPTYKENLTIKKGYLALE